MSAHTIDNTPRFSYRAPMRISGGALVRRQLHAPPGLATRPTSDKVRQALFNILGPAPAGAATLDLFAGTGALGIEALSRGAARAVFVDQDRGALHALRRNLHELELQARAEILAQDVFRGLGGLRGRSFDLVFADPPYQDAAALLPRLLQRLGEDPLLVAAAGTVVVEFATTGTTLALPERCGRLRRSDQRSYGQTGLMFYVATDAANTVESQGEAST